MSFIFIHFFSFLTMLEGIQTVKKMPVFRKANTKKNTDQKFKYPDTAVTP